MDRLPSEKEAGKARLLKWSKGILTAAGAILLFLLVSISVSFLYSFICLAQGVTDTEAITGLVEKNASLLNLVVNVFVFMFLILFSLTKRGKPVERLRIHPINPAKVFGFILFGICLNVFMSLAFSLIPFPEAMVEAQNEAYSPYFSDIFMAVISVGFATGIAEELLFRSALISPLRSAFGKIPALIISAVVFSLFHTSAIAKIYSLILGLLLGLFFLKYDSVIPAIIIHISFNCTSFVIGILENARMEFIVITCIISALFLVRMFIWLYVRYPGFSDILFDKGGRLRPDDLGGQVIYDRIRELRENEEEVDRNELEELNEDWEDFRKNRKRRKDRAPESENAETATEQAPETVQDAGDGPADSQSVQSQDCDPDEISGTGTQTEVESKEGDSDDQTV